ncbi:MAG: hypothetical protein P1P90_02905 [Patescibacteria group bacterium]|nr:hypothetical protein [Patescibacteria group bacterium]
MVNRYSDADIRNFINWVLMQDDLELLDDVKRFLRQLYVFAKMQYGGDEYCIQLEILQNHLSRLLRTVERFDRAAVPIALHLLATYRKRDRTTLDWARAYVPIACDVLHLDPIQACHPPCQCRSSIPPA